MTAHPPSGPGDASKALNLPVPPSAEEEARFLAALRTRDERAFNTLVTRFQDRVYNLVYRFLGGQEEARDVAQEVFVTVFEKIETYRGESSLATWIFRIATNHAKNRIKYLARRHDRKQESFDAMAVQPAESRFSAKVPRPDEAATQAELSALVDRALAQLDEEQRIVVVLRDIEGQSYEDIALITGLQLGTVKSRIHRARQRLKELLAPTVGRGPWGGGE